MQWFDPYILIWVGISSVLNILTIHFWDKKYFLKLGFIKYRGLQRIHKNETPRLGGLIFLISLFGYAIFSKNNEDIILLKLILFSLIPIIIFGLKEDLYHDVLPAIRLISLFFVGWIFFTEFSMRLPDLTNIPIIGNFLLIPGSTALIYILGMMTIANGFNLIDGVNGLAVSIALSILCSLFFVSYRTADVAMLSLILSLSLLLIPFLLANYPLGLIFLGDLGAYAIGLILSMATIIFFGRHPEISPWGAVLLMIYPLSEVVFTLLRRIATRVSIFKPDKEHMHFKFFIYFRKLKNLKKIANPVVTPVLAILWVFPLLSFIMSYQNPLFIRASIIIFIFLYALFYAIGYEIIKTR
ncbi:Rfe UDP-N-acetylmuramyl pentapeptide phosphotransferase/UDP-N- acetylglucosamine-1-phosphate transferase [Candidatus Methylopumilus planktonicus]